MTMTIVAKVRAGLLAALAVCIGLAWETGVRSAQAEPVFVPRSPHPVASVLEHAIHHAGDVAIEDLVRPKPNTPSFGVVGSTLRRDGWSITFTGGRTSSSLGTGFLAASPENGEFLVLGVSITSLNAQKELSASDFWLTTLDQTYNLSLSGSNALKAASVSTPSFLFSDSIAARDSRQYDLVFDDDPSPTLNSYGLHAWGSVVFVFSLDAQT